MSLRVNGEIIRNLNDEALNQLMSRILLNEAYRCGADQRLVIVNIEIKASDEGQDGYTPVPLQSSRWLGETETCWQFKRGKAGEPENLRGEILKSIPQKVLKNGGRYVVIAPNAIGETARNKRLKVLLEDATSLGLPTDKIDVFCCEQITNWVNEHQSIVIEIITGKQSGMFSLDMWEKMLQPDLKFVEIESFIKNIKTIQNGLIGNSKSPSVHIYGPQGVGRTRLVFEASHSADWRGEVIYMPHIILSEVNKLVVTMWDTPQSQVVLVIDNLLNFSLESILSLIKPVKDRLRLITIGDNRYSHHEGDIQFLNISPLNESEMGIIVKSLFPNMHSDHRRYVVSLSGGFINWAQMIGEAIVKDPKLFAVEQVRLHRKLLQRMIGESNDYNHLLIVAIMEFVGWNGIHSDEGRLIAEHLGLNWTEILLKVHRFHENCGHAPLNGDFRSISPEPLAIFLAKEVWDALGDILDELPEKLPSDSARDRFYRRLKVVAADGKGHAAKHAMRQLIKFGSLENFTSAHKVRIWSCVGVVNPSLALKQVYSALRNATKNERLSLPLDARRELIWALVEARSKSAMFNMAALSLAELAESETEYNIQNNARGEFLVSFHPILGGTEKPYSERLNVLDQLLKRELSYRSLAISALAQIGDCSSCRSLPGPSKIGPEAIEWTPSMHEYLDAIKLGLKRLTELVQKESNDLSDEIIKACQLCVWMLFNVNTHESVSKLLTVVFSQIPLRSEELEAFIEEKLTSGQECTQANPLIKKTKVFLQKNRNPAIDARFRHLMRTTGYDPSQKPSKEIAKMAATLLKEPEILWSNWVWLTNSGQAYGTRHLAEALGILDKERKLLQVMLDKTENIKDSSIICFYLIGHSQVVGKSVIEDLIDAFEKKKHNQDDVLFEITHFSSDGERAGQRTARILKRSSSLKNYRGRLGHARWVKNLSENTLLGLVKQSSISLDTLPNALAMLDTWMKNQRKHSKKIEKVALDLISNENILEVKDMTIPTCWKDMSMRLMTNNARHIARAIFMQINRNGSYLWLGDYTTIIHVLNTSAKTDPDGVSEELIKLLESPESSVVLIRNFPKGIMKMLSKEKILNWIERDPRARCKLISGLMQPDICKESLFNILKRMSLQLDIYEENDESLNYFAYHDNYDLIN